MARPLISVGMPARNSARTIESAIQSILWQTYEDWELIVADDGSQDDTVARAKSLNDPRIRVITNSDSRGSASRRNQTIDASRGEYYAVMDSDDLSYPDRFERQVDFLEANPSVDLTGVEMLAFRGDGDVIGRRSAPPDHAGICARPSRGFPLYQPGFMGRTQWFRRFRYNETVRRIDDQELLLRSYRSSRFANVPEILVAYRENELHLGKILLGRREFARHSRHLLFEQGRPAAAIAVTLEQGVKGAVDIVAVTTGLGYRLLRHRAIPAAPEDVDAFRMLWNRLTR